MRICSACEGKLVEPFWCLKMAISVWLRELSAARHPKCHKFQYHCLDFHHSSSEQMEDVPAKQLVVWLTLVLAFSVGSHQTHLSGRDSLLGISERSK